MTRTSDILIECAYTDDIPPLSVLVDYFGDDNLTNEKITIIFGLYVGLIKFGFTNSNELHKNFMNKSLDSFIRKKYNELSKKYSSGYYKIFCDKNMKITSNYLTDDEDE